MVGKEMELDLLCEQLADVVDAGAAALVTVVGGAGVGKSRLLYDLLDWLEIQPVEVSLFRA